MERNFTQPAFFSPQLFSFFLSYKVTGKISHIKRLEVRQGIKKVFVVVKYGSFLDGGRRMLFLSKKKNFNN